MVGFFKVALNTRNILVTLQKPTHSVGVNNFPHKVIDKGETTRHRFHRYASTTGSLNNVFLQ